MTVIANIPDILESECEDIVAKIHEETDEKYARVPLATLLIISHALTKQDGILDDSAHTVLDNIIGNLITED